MKYTRRDFIKSNAALAVGFSAGGVLSTIAPSVAALQFNDFHLLILRRILSSNFFWTVLEEASHAVNWNCTLLPAPVLCCGVWSERPRNDRYNRNFL